MKTSSFQQTISSVSRESLSADVGPIGQGADVGPIGKGADKQLV